MMTIIRHADGEWYIGDDRRNYYPDRQDSYPSSQAATEAVAEHARQRAADIAQSKRIERVRELLDQGRTEYEIARELDVIDASRLIAEAR